MFCLLLNLSSLSAFCIFFHPCLHVCKCVFMSIRLSVYLCSVSAYICPSVHMFFSLCPCAYPSVCLCVHMFFRLFVCPYMHLQTSLCGRCSCRYNDAIAANL